MIDAGDLGAACYTRRSMQRRWLVIAAIAVGGLAVLFALVLGVLYPRVGAWAVRSKAIPRLEARLGSKVEVGAIDVGRGHAVLSDVVVRGDGGGDPPLVAIRRVEVDFDFGASLLGKVELGGVTVDGLEVVAVAGKDGTNYETVLAALRKKPDGGGGKGGGGTRPRSVTLKDARVELRDEVRGITVLAEGASARVLPGEPVTGQVASLAAITAQGPRASLEDLELSASPDDPLGTAVALVGDGKLDVSPGMSLTGVKGSIAPGDAPGVLKIDLSGGYAGVEGTLWRARGWVDPRAQTGDLGLRAERFTFDRIAPVLESSPVVDYAATSLDAEFNVKVERDAASISGEFDLKGLNLFHPGLAEEPMTGLGGRGALTARYDRTSHVLELDEAKLTTGGVDYVLSARIERNGERDPARVAELASAGQTVHALLYDRKVSLRMRVLPVPCQKMLASIPPAFIPKLQGFKLKGTFATDIGVELAWGKLEETKLTGSVGIYGCKVLEAPKEMDAERLRESFDHEVEIEKDVWQTIHIGPESPAFIPLNEVSLHLINSLMTTEDSSFYNHHGFIVREFRTALIKDIEAGYFKYGASSITMQMVKNVLLSRQKTIGRKLQELFLTWYIEQVLEKERILEIYVNAIEYGPGLYGIRPAAAQYFNKHPADLNPAEAAFFSSILPAPKRRYIQFCKDKLSTWTENKIDRILDLMVQRQRLPPEELEAAKATPVIFQPDKSGDFCTKKWGEEAGKDGEEPAER